MANTQSSVINIFTDLVKIPSPSGKEELVRQYILKKIKKIADYLYIDKAGNVYIKIKGNSSKTLLICAHMDTVKPTGVQNPKIKGEYIHSNGKYVLGADNKAAVAAILSYLLTLDKKSLPVTLEILFTVREETEGGIREFPKEKIKAKQAFVIDISGPMGSVVTKSAYVGGYAVYSKAKGCHVKRINTNTVHPLNLLSQFIKKIPFGRITKDTIVNIAKVRMGESYNSVPELLYFTGEIRSFNQKTYTEFFKKVQKTIKALDERIGTSSKLELYPYCKGYSLKEKDLKTIKKVFRKLKMKLKGVETFGVGDSNILAEWGIKPINISSGALSVHTTKERISKKSLILSQKILEEYINLFDTSS